MIISFSDSEKVKKKYPIKKGNILVEGMGTYFFEPTEAIGEVPQTKVTFASKVDLKGQIPAQFVNIFATNYLTHISDLRKYFDKSKEIESFKISSGNTASKMSRNSIEPSLLVDSFELEFEKDEKGQFVSLGKGAFGNVLLAHLFLYWHTLKLN